MFILGETFGKIVLGFAIFYLSYVFYQKRANKVAYLPRRRKKAQDEAQQLMMSTSSQRSEVAEVPLMEEPGLKEGMLYYKSLSEKDLKQKDKFGVPPGAKFDPFYPPETRIKRM